jgi:hypothetical protein
MLTPCSRFVVANVWRNLWRYHYRNVALVCGFGFESSAIQISTTRYSFQFGLEFLVRPALTSGKDEVIGIGAGLTNFLLLESCTMDRLASFSNL